ncbi:hypothetical protein [Leuconostoc lactis]|uniref:hypothetical protein n=1 Tax=Leuconostoc lactis TaxID=1246 RepID=UPI000814C649|nr:hypothetical protein [Leuconostoc lactis]ANY12344.1 hypothetical protein BCR17_08130 [Leuconostoc lactis]
MPDLVITDIVKLTPIITAFAAITGIIFGVIGLLNANKQITLNNKHFMYEKRVSSYMFFVGLLAMFEPEREPLSKGRITNEPYFESADDTFQMLTNNSQLFGLKGEYENSSKNIDEHNKYITLIEEFRSQGQMFEFEFSGEAGKLANEFVKKYFDFLDQLRDYKILYNGVKNCLTDELNNNNQNILKAFNEESMRGEAFDSFDKLNAVYQEIIDKNIMENLQNQIQLTQGGLFSKFTIAFLSESKNKD